MFGLRLGKLLAVFVLLAPLASSTTGGAESAVLKALFDLVGSESGLSELNLASTVSILEEIESDHAESSNANGSLASHLAGLLKQVQELQDHVKFI